MKNTGLTIFLGMILIQAVYCQEVDLYTPFTPQKNNVIQKFDTLNIRECYNLDKSNSIGVVFRYWQVDMWVSLFRDNRSNVTISDFDTINVTDSTRFHFYQTQDPADGIVIIWESRYDYYSELRAYIFRNGTLKRMGRIDIDLDDISTDKVHYPVSDIQVEKEGKSVIFSFRKPLVLRISERFSPEHFFYLWNGGNQLLPVKNGIVGKPPW